MVSPGDLLLPLGKRLLDWMIAEIGQEDREVLLLIFLDRGGAFLGIELIDGGTRCSHRLPYRLLFERSFRRGAGGILLAHNHPSGSPLPSELDIASTRRLQALTIPMELRLIDHLIVSQGTVFSMRTAGLLDRPGGAQMDQRISPL